MGRRSEQTLFQGEHTGGHRLVLSITNHQVLANQNQSECITSHFFKKTRNK